MNKPPPHGPSLDRLNSSVRDPQPDGTAAIEPQHYNAVNRPQAPVLQTIDTAAASAGTGEGHNGTSRGVRSPANNWHVAQGSNGTPEGSEERDNSAAVAQNQSASENDTAGGDKAAMPGKQLPVYRRFWRDVRVICCSSVINVLLVFVPIGIAFGILEKVMGKDCPISPVATFSVNAIAIIPLAYLLSFATECVACNLGDTVGALLNVTFGNAVELIILIALVNDQVAIVQASLLGSILANLLLILGMCFFFGGLRFQEQLYNKQVTQVSASLLCLSVTSLIVPTVFHVAFEDKVLANIVVLKLSRGTSIILLVTYVIYLLFQLKSHSYIYRSTPQEKIDEESHPGVLADILDSSSSSESSRCSAICDDSDGNSSFLHRKRFTRVLRRHRKHSVTSQTTDTSHQSQHQQGNPVSSHDTNQHTDHGNLARFAGDRDDAALLATTGAQRYAPPPRYGHGTAAEARVAEAPHDASRASPPKGKRGHRFRHRKHRQHKTVIEKQESPVQNTSGQLVRSQRGSLAGRTFMGMVETRRGDFSPLPVCCHPVQTNPTMPTTMPPPCMVRRAYSMPTITSTAQYRTVSPTQTLRILLPNDRTRATVRSEKDEAPDAKFLLSRTTALITLIVSTGLVAACAEFLVDSIDYMVEHTGVSQAFIGLIILPIVGNAAEHVTAVSVACKNKMDLAIAVALGSSIQIALFVTPVVVLLGWCLGRDMSLFFTLLETVSLFATSLIVNYLVMDGRTNYLEGTLLISTYVILAVAAFYYPECRNQSPASGPRLGRC